MLGGPVGVVFIVAVERAEFVAKIALGYTLVAFDGEEEFFIAAGDEFNAALER